MPVEHHMDQARRREWGVRFDKDELSTIRGDVVVWIATAAAGIVGNIRLVEQQFRRPGRPRVARVDLHHHELAVISVEQLRSIPTPDRFASSARRHHLFATGARPCGPGRVAVRGHRLRDAIGEGRPDAPLADEGGDIVVPEAGAGTERHSGLRRTGQSYRNGGSDQSQRTRRITVAVTATGTRVERPTGPEIWCCRPFLLDSFLGACFAILRTQLTGVSQAALGGHGPAFWATETHTEAEGLFGRHTTAREVENAGVTSIHGSH